MVLPRGKMLARVVVNRIHPGSETRPKSLDKPGIWIQIAAMAKLLGWRLDDARAKRDLEIAQARASGLTFQEVADAAGLTKQRVIQICKTFGDAAKPPDDYMEKRAKTEEVSQLFREGKSVAEIERLSGLSGRTIYRRLKKTKTPTKQLLPLWDRLAMRTIFGSGCWLWTGYKTGAGYGTLCATVKRTALAHRLMYMELIGPIPKGLTLDHLCRQRDCVNPYHCEPVTLEENTRRGVKVLKTHCKRGHPLTPDNIYSIPSAIKNRACLTCRRKWARDHGIAEPKR